MAFSISEADYLIVGGGLTGCALASCLHQGDPSLNVTILEAGDDASSNPQTRDIGGAFTLAGSELNFNYKTTAQSNTGKRVHSITAGKVLGGGSFLNYGAWARGDAADYDQWGRIVEDRGWSYDGLLPHLKRPENHFGAGANPDQRGSIGPMRVTSVLESDPKRDYGLREPIRTAWKELGLEQNPNEDCGSLSGICELLENWDNGQRQPSNLAYSLQGVAVITGALVHKVLFIKGDGGSQIASAIILSDGRHFNARKEIILCAGTIRTPQLLMLSGIGSAEMLSKYNIPLVYNNPEVGRNYFENLAHFQV